MFALWVPASIHGVIIVGLIASLLFCSLAFILGWLTLDGAAAAVIVGTTAFGFGGWPTVAVVICFFISGTLISMEELSSNYGDKFGTSDGVRRDGLQVWANGFWLVLWLVAGILTNLFVCWMAAVAVMAAATADTWATELGSRRFSATTYLSTTFEQVPPGTEGGISWPGLAASMAGSFFIAMVAAFGFSLSLGWIICITLAGFSASLADSYIGAKFQGTSTTLTLPGVSLQKQISIDNNMVNCLSTGFGSLMLLILNMVFL
jgi:uncharacterized protein (TIGR00297 family)